MKLVPQCLNYSSTASQYFFEVATILFKSSGNAYYAALDVTTYVHDWSDLLLKHEHKEVSGSTPVWHFDSNDE